MRLLRLAALAVVALTAGCSKEDDFSILGHWRAERVQVDSLQLPVGPDIEIKEHEVSNTDTGTSITLEGIESKGDEVVLDMPFGVGLSLYFDGPDLMYANMPLVGKIYYRRVRDDTVAAAPVPSASSVSSAPSAPPASAVPVATPTKDRLLMQQAEQAMRDGSGERAEALLVQALAYPSAHPAVDYDLAVLAARSADPDGAIDHLNEAFKRGFRQFSELDSSPDFDALHSDVRFQALVSRYR